MTDIPPTGGSPPIRNLPWEDPGVAWFQGLAETAKLVLTDPRAAFARMSRSPEMTRPLLYGVIFLSVAGIISSFMHTLFPGMLGGVLSGDAGSMLAIPFMGALSIILWPLFSVFCIFLTAALTHVVLSLVGGANHPFAVTLRTYCYACTPYIIGILPFCGGMIGGLWTLGLFIFGLSITQETTLGKAAAGVLLPSILCCLVVGGLSMFAGLLAGG